MASDIRQKIILEGEKEYSSSIKEAQRNLKTLRSELKAETAELGKNATEQQKAEVKTKNLQKQIAEQEKIVKANKKALEEVREKYGDNAEAVAKYEQKLNESRAALANMKNQLDSTGESFKSIQKNADLSTVATKSLADSFASLASVGESVSSAIENVFTGMINTISNAFGEIWNMVTDTAAKANNWTDLASYYGTTAAAIQEMDSAITATQGDFSKFTNLMNQLSWGGKEKKISEFFGVSDANYTDKLQYTLAVISAMQDLYSTNPSQFDKAMENVFGAKKTADITWFVSNWDKIMENRSELKENGFLLSDNNLSTMNDVWLELGEIEEKWNALKRQFASGFGQVTLDVATNVSGSLDAIAKYFNADSEEERNAALDKLEQNITEAFNRIVDAIQTGVNLVDELAAKLKDSDNPTAQALGNIMSAFVDALKWITEDNMSNVIKALEKLAEFWLIGKGLSMAAKIASIVADIGVIKAFTGGGAAGAAGAGAGVGLITKITTILSGILPDASSIIGANIGPVVDWLTHESPVAGLLTGQESVEEFGEKIAETFSEESVKAFKDNWDPNNPDSNIFAQLGKNNILFWDKVAKLNASANEWILPDDATAEEIEAFVKMQEALANTVEEYLDLDEKHYTDEDRENAIQDWYDAWRTGADDEESAWAWLKEVFGDEWGDVYESIIRNLDNLSQLDQMNLTDIPSDWWNNSDALTGNDAQDMTRAVLQLPAATARALNGARFSVDGQAFANLVIPMVSQGIARDMIG